MKNLVKIAGKDIPKMALPSIEIIELSESSGGDIRCFAFRDRATQEELHFRCSQYHEMTAYGLKPKEYVEKHKLTGKIDGVAIEALFDNETKAIEYGTRNNVQNVNIAVVKIEV